MKLSVLVHYQNLLAEVRAGQCPDLVGQGLLPVLDLVRRSNVKFDNLDLALEHSLQTVRDSVDQFNHSTDQINLAIQDMIESLERSYFANSYKLYEGNHTGETTDHLLEKFLPLTQDQRTYLRSRVQFYSNWNHPAVCIRPATEEWVDHMVANDPLYLVDTHHDLFSPVKNKFNPQYQARLRYYVINEEPQKDSLYFLPDEQFGFMFAYNYFHYRPFELIRAYLTEIYQKLRPGGCLAFTFNNCDRRGAVELVERHCMCYTPGRLITALIDSIGYEIKHRFELDAATTWLEIVKPGLKPSYRGGQTLAILNPKNVAQSS